MREEESLGTRHPSRMTSPLPTVFKYFEGERNAGIAGKRKAKGGER